MFFVSKTAASLKASSSESLTTRGGNRGLNLDSPVGLIVELAVADVEVVSWDIARAYVLTDVQDRSRRKLRHEIALVDTTLSRVLFAII